MVKIQCIRVGLYTLGQCIALAYIVLINRKPEKEQYCGMICDFFQHHVPQFCQLNGPINAHQPTFITKSADCRVFYGDLYSDVITTNRTVETVMRWRTFSDTYENAGKNHG